MSTLPARSQSDPRPPPSALRADKIGKQQVNIGRQTRLLFGISIFWLALSVLSDGINTLVLPLQVSGTASQNNQATILGLLTFVGLLAGALIQPVAGAFSDR